MLRCGPSVSLRRFGKSVSSENIFPMKTGLKSKIVGDSMFDQQQQPANSSMADKLAILGKAAELLHKKPQVDSDEHPRDREFTYKPTLPRQWVRAPISVLSTAASRRDWFRVMQFNMMADSFTNFTADAAAATAPQTTPASSSSPKSSGNFTTPVLELDVRIPSFSRPQQPTTSSPPSSGSERLSGDGDGADGTQTKHLSQWVTYDRSIDTELPPFLNFPFRRSYLVNEVRYYDPDILCLNEVNRVHFNGELWKYLRSQGYGSLYSSSRGYQVRSLRSKENANVRGNENKVPEWEDIGNAIFFHKSRFVPHLMGGAELPNHLHYAQFCSLKDKVTNMTVVLANVQFTLGDTEEAICIRKHEASMTMKVIRAICAESVDRAHSTVMIVGDFNCSHEEEPCVQVIRKELFSTYDLVGGPRWTTWCRGKEGVKPNKYYDDNKRSWEDSDTARGKLLEQVEAVKRREADRLLARTARRVAGAVPSNASEKPSASTAEDVNLSSDTVLPKKIIKQFEERIVDEKFPWLSETRMVEREVSVTPDEAAFVAKKDEIAEQRELQLRHGIIKRTQDFVFYDPHTIALHQVLDTPDDALIDEQQMLPSSKHPSHHVPLMVDFSFNDVNPDVGSKSKRP